jgi:hypothetical protein
MRIACRARGRIGATSIAPISCDGATPPAERQPRRIADGIATSRGRLARRRLRVRAFVDSRRASAHYPEANAKRARRPSEAASANRLARTAGTV